MWCVRCRRRCRLDELDARKIEVECHEHEGILSDVVAVSIRQHTSAYLSMCQMHLSDVVAVSRAVKAEVIHFHNAHFIPAFIHCVLKRNQYRLQALLIH